MQALHSAVQTLYVQCDAQMLAPAAEAMYILMHWHCVLLRRPCVLPHVIVSAAHCKYCILLHKHHIYSAAQTEHQVDHVAEALRSAAHSHCLLLHERCILLHILRMLLHMRCILHAAQEVHPATQTLHSHYRHWVVLLHTNAVVFNCSLRCCSGIVFNCTMVAFSCAGLAFNLKRHFVLLR
jgi:hypothetical protein